MRKRTFIILIIVTLVVFIGLVILTVLQSKNKEIIEEQVKKTTTPPKTFIPPTLDIKPSPPSYTVNRKIRKRLIEQLPYENQRFLVEYLPKVDLLYVTIKQAPFEENQQRAINWLKAQGILKPKKDSSIRFRYLNVEPPK